MMAELDADSTQHQQPQHHHQREIEAAEAGGIQQRESEIQRAACGQQPHFIAIPYRTDSTNHGAPLFVIAGDEQMDCASSEIEAIQQNVNCNHHRYDHEPNR